MPDAVVLAPLVVAGSLVAAGLAKLRGGVRLEEAFAALAVPAALSGPRGLSALPWLEIVVGLSLLLPGAAYVVATAAAALLLVVYTVLVLRAVVGGREVDCDCFGGLGDGRVGPRTVVRNVVLLGCAVLALVDSLAGRTLLGRLTDLDAGGWAWLAGAALLVVLLVATVATSSGGTVDTERRGIPYLSVSTADGRSVSLPELASERPQLLVTLSTSCSQCARVSEAIADWPALLPELDVHVLTALPAGEPVPDAWPGVLHDPQERVATVLGLVRPSAVLLGADALVAGGPVHGASAVIAFVEEIEKQLQGR